MYNFNNYKSKLSKHSLKETIFSALNISKQWIRENQGQCFESEEGKRTYNETSELIQDPEVGPAIWV